MKTMAVENWLDDYPHSRRVKSQIRNLMHTLFNAAVRWEMLERNPTDLVRQSNKRLKTPRVLAPAEFKALLGQLTEPYKTMVITIACSGRRVGELLGLQWGDIDFENLTVKIQRNWVKGTMGETKREASEGALPLDPHLAEILLSQRAGSVYLAGSDFVFASKTGKPRWAENMLRNYGTPTFKQH